MSNEKNANPPTESAKREDALSRRSLLHYSAAAVATGTLASASARAGQAETPAWDGTRVVANQRIKQSVCRWCYGRIPLEELVVAAKTMGLGSVEILDPKDFATVKKHGLICAMTNSHSIPKGLNDKANHESCLDAIRTSIEATADAGFPNVICFSGNRETGDQTIPDDVGLENCVSALKSVVGFAEKRGVTLMMELLNSKVDHRGYMADNVAFGVELVERVGSERFKLLYDIYHMQIMDGDVIRTIRDHHDKIGHYHTAGVPGRHELDEQQELFYPAIIRAILETGYEGYLGQEFIPVGDEPLSSLAHGVRLCDV